MPTAAEQATAVGLWVDQATSASQRVRESSTALTESAWAQFTTWYSIAAVTAQAEAIAEVSQAGQEAVAGLFTEYVAQTVAMLRDSGRVQVPSVRPPSVRNGADPVRVHSRPADEYRKVFSLSGDEDLAVQKAAERAIQLLETDLMLAARQAQDDAMSELKITRYRRVLRPELSQDGPCGLCVVAADNIYRIGDLLPLHDRCKCITIGVLEGADVGPRLNRDDLDRIYAAAGSSQGRDLKRVRVQVNEHGELGPVLTVRGHHFTGPKDLSEPDPGRAERRLAKLQEVLGKLEQRSSNGEDLDDALAYQEGAIDRMSRIVGPGGPGGSAGGGGGKPPRPPAPPSSAGDEDGNEWIEGFPFAGGDVNNPDLSRLTGDESDAIAFYASFGYNEINRELERGTLSPEAQRLVDLIRAGLEKYPLPGTIRVSRETELSDLGVTDYGQLADLIDQRISFRSFLSTSVSPNPPPITLRRQPITLDLVVPVGTPALRIVKDLVEPGQEHERELLLIDGRTIQVFGVLFDPVTRRWRVRAYVLPRS